MAFENVKVLREVMLGLSQSKPAIIPICLILYYVRKTQ